MHIFLLRLLSTAHSFISQENNSSLVDGGLTGPAITRTDSPSYNAPQGTDHSLSHLYTVKLESSQVTSD